MAPEPGIYYDIPPEDYHAWDAVSKSRLSYMDESPLHFRWNMDHPRGPTDAMKFGTAVHAAIFEPKVFMATYAIAPDVKRNTKAGKAEWEAFVGAHPDKTLLPEDEWQCCQRIAEQVFINEPAKKLLNMDGRAEVSLVWVDDDTGVKCKARLDWWVNDIVVIGDLKTTKSAGPSFARDIITYKYDMQGAMYQDAVSVLGADASVADFVLIAAEKTPPFDVVCYRLDESHLEIGRAMYKKFLKMYADCTARNEWPGRCGGLRDAVAPEWRIRQMETDL
jgi:exodeoxyribonuclease VIII